MVAKKRNVSVRLHAGDLQKIKQIAQRMHVRESDVFRFAIKTTLANLAALYETQAKGRELIPLFSEWGAQITKHFELDTASLNKIINEGLSDPAKAVDIEDIELIALSALDERYMLLKLRDQPATTGADAVKRDAEKPLRAHLLAKYLGHPILETIQGAG